MASTYSTNLKIELIGTGEQSGTWGNTTNTNLGTLIEEAIAGYVTQAVTDGAATVLTIPNGTSSNGRNYVIELTGALTANRTVEVPAVDKPYIFFNNTTGGYSVTVKVSGQTGVTIANGKKAIVYTNSTDVIDVVNAPVSEAGTQTLSNKTLASPTVTGVATFAAGTVSAPALTTTGDTNTGIFFPAADTIAFAEGGAEAMRLDSSGNVGIGTSSPGGYKLNVSGTALVTSSITTNSDLQVNPSGYNLYLRNIGGTNRIDSYNSPITNTVPLQLNASLMTFYIADAEKMRIDSSGNVGIGTSSPAASFSVVKQTTALSGTGNAYGLYMYPTSSGLTYIDAITGSAGNTSLGFRTYNNGTYNEMRMDSSGNVGIGTSSPAVKLHSTGGVGSTGGSVTSTGAAITMYYDTANDYGVTSTLNNGVGWKQYVIRSAGIIFKSSSDTEAFRFGTSGQLGIGGANYGTSGQVLTSQGSGAAPVWSTPSSGGVTSLTAGSGITVSASTGAVTVSQDFYTGSTVANATYPIGSYLAIYNQASTTPPNANATTSVFSPPSAGGYRFGNASMGTGSVSLTGTWRNRGNTGQDTEQLWLVQRTA